MTDETQTQAPNAPDNRRQARRFEVALAASERTGPFEVVWTTTDLSTTGLSMRESFSRPVGTKVQLSLELGDGEEPLEVEAEVVGPYDLEGGIRVSFGALTDADRARIEAALHPEAASTPTPPTP